MAETISSFPGVLICVPPCLGPKPAQALFISVHAACMLDGFFSGMPGLQLGLSRAGESLLHHQSLYWPRATPGKSICVMHMPLGFYSSANLMLGPFYSLTVPDQAMWLPGDPSLATEGNHLWCQMHQLTGEAPRWIPKRWECCIRVSFR